MLGALLEFKPNRIRSRDLRGPPDRLGELRLRPDHSGHTALEAPAVNASLPDDGCVLFLLREALGAEPGWNLVAFLDGPDDREVAA